MTYLINFEEDVSFQQVGPVSCAVEHGVRIHEEADHTTDAGENEQDGNPQKESRTVERF